VSSFSDANTVFEGQQINGQTHQRKDKEKRRDKTEIRHREGTPIEEITEERSKDRSETQRQRVRVHCKPEIVVTTSGVVSKEV
jgi:hypothetical protein